MSVFEFTPTRIPGCFEIQSTMRFDERGHFVKTMYAPEFQARGLECDFVEEYFSGSHAGVIRGMHFQLPPHDHAKLVYCPSGAVLDVVLDLRVGSPTYQQAIGLELSAENAKMLYIPRGLAHGFQSLRDNTLMFYKVTSGYAPEHDSGVRFDTFGAPWTIDHPITSQRDLDLPQFERFNSPFTYEANS
jgi:dTDP-4-dehydrorhamnose 3,5-epimerase